MPRYVLEVLSGALAGQRFPVERRLTLGREAGNDVCFDAPEDRIVSARHAVLEPTEDGIRFLDLGSTNGSWRGDERVADWLLMPGYEVRLGRQGPRLRVVPVPDPPPAAVNPAPAPRLEPQPGSPSPAPTTEGPSDPPAAPSPVAPAPGAQGLRAAPPDLSPASPSDDTAARPGSRRAIRAGDYTMALTQRLKEEGDVQSLQMLIEDEERVGRAVESGVLESGQARMLRSASATVRHNSRRARRLVVVISSLAIVLIGILGGQNLRYRQKLKSQEALFVQVRQLEQALLTARSPDDPARMAMVARLRESERELMKLRASLSNQDQAATYSNPLGYTIQDVLRDFGRQNYIVPDIFIQQVQGYLTSFQRSPESRRILERSFANKPKYQRIIEDELRRMHMPRAFLYLAMHESMLDNTIVSATGARGLWQLMPATARELGLKVPAGWQTLPVESDDRTDPEKSTRAGVQFLKQLLADFGDVALTMAAYNAGPGRIRGALRKIPDPVNNRDFWFIYRMGILAEETNEYVPKIVATMIIDRDRAKYGYR